MKFELSYQKTENMESSLFDLDLSRYQDLILNIKLGETGTFIDFITLFIDPLTIAYDLSSFPKNITLLSCN